MTAAKNRRLLADLSLVLVAAVWGATFVMVKDAVREAGPLTFLALRFGLATAMLVPALPAAGGRLSAAPLAGGGAAGLLLFAGYALQTAGLQFTSASKAGFITGLAVVIVPLLVALVVGRLPSRGTTLGVALATLGLALLSLEDDLAIGSGELLVLGCAVAFALHILAVGHFAPRAGVLALTFGQIAAAALLTTAGALLLERPTLEQLRAVLPAAAFTGVFATVGAFFLQTRAQRFTSPTHTALIFSMEPVFAALFGYLLAGERLGARAILGCALILLGMLAAQLAPEREGAAESAA